jgi:hypothetical protein
LKKLCELKPKSKVEKLRDFPIDVILSVIIPLIGVLYFLKDVVFPLNGFIFYGDVGVFIHFDLNDFTRTCLYTWSGQASTGYLSLLPYFVYALLGQALGFQMEQRIQIILLAVLPATTMYFAVKILAKEWLPELVDKRWKEHFLASIASVLYEFNYVNSNITDPLGAAGLQYAYIFLPLTFVLFVKYLCEGRLRDLLILCFLSAFVAISPLWIVFFSFMVIVYLAFTLVLGKGYKLQLFVKRLSLSVMALLVVNTFWILPAITGYLQEATGPFQVYQPAKRLSYEGMKAMYRLLDAIMFGHKTYNLFGIWPQNWNMVNIVIPITAFISLLILKRNKHVLFLCCLALISTFMVKATSPPLGGLYYQLALRLPYGVGAVLANYNTWAYIQAFSYFFLISLTLLALVSKGSKKKLRILTALILQLAILYSVLNGLYVDSQVYLPRFKPQDIPQIYYEVNEWLNQQPKHVKVLWLPSGGTYVWKKYIITGFPDTISIRMPIRAQLVTNALAENKSLTEMLTYLGVRYVIFHNDVLDSTADLHKKLSEQGDLTIVATFQEKLPVRNDFNSPFSSLSRVTEYNGAWVKLIEPINMTLFRGQEARLKVRYHVPLEILQKMDYRSIKASRVWVFEAGSEFDPSRLLYHHIRPTGFTAFNETDGILEFPILINEKYDGNCVDVYVDFYGSGLSYATLLLYIGRFKVESQYILLNCLIFENLEYKGPVFVGDNEKATIIDYKCISPVEWEVVVNASNPFILIFTEPYDRLWKAYVNGKEVEPIMLYSMVNGFPINETGILRIKIYYTLQTYYNVGLFTSGIGFITLTSLCTYRSLLRKLNKNKTAKKRS